MSYSLSVSENYICVRWDGIVTDYLLKNCVTTLVSNPDYLKNGIYDLRDAVMEITSISMFGIARHIKLFYPSDGPEIKIAIVVLTGYQKAIVEMFAEEGEQTSCKIKSFFDIKSAEMWINQL